MQLSRLSAGVVLVALLASSCGDDGTEPLSYCATLAALGDETAIIGDEADPDALDAALDLYDRLVETAPADVIDSAEVLAEAAATIADEGDDAGIDPEAVAAATASIAASAAAACDLDLS